MHYNYILYIQLPFLLIHERKSTWNNQKIRQKSITTILNVWLNAVWIRPTNAWAEHTINSWDYLFSNLLRIEYIYTSIAYSDVWTQNSSSNQFVQMNSNTSEIHVTSIQYKNMLINTCSAFVCFWEFQRRALVRVFRVCFAVFKLKFRSINFHCVAGSSGKLPLESLYWCG